MVEMVISLEDETMLGTLKNILKSFSGIANITVHKKEKVRQEVYDRMVFRLDELAGLQANWDDDGALPIEKKVVSNVRKFLDKSQDVDLKDWAMFPDVNGTILLENQSGSVVSIGNLEFSYTSSNGNGRGIKYSPSSLLKTIRAINGK